MKSLVLLMLIVSGAFATESQLQKKTTPKELGLTLKNGSIDRNKMTPGQKDTIAIGLFNFEDYLFDIAVASSQRSLLIIYRNSGNGSLSEYSTFQLTNEVLKLELLTPEMFLCPSARCGLKIIFKDKTSRTISSKEINHISEEKSLSPLSNLFDNPKIFLYDISFVEKWRSERNGQPHNWVTLGDIDRDGKNEAIYTFFNDTSYYFTRIVVFENVSEYQYRIDWDTLLVFGGYNEMSKITDFDRDGNFEFMGVSMAVWNQPVHGLFECYGPGQYKFRFAGYNHPLTLYGVELKDSVTANGITKPGLWVCYSEYSPDESYLWKLRFDTKISSGFGFRQVTESPVQYDGFVYSMSANDIDEDGKDEVILGETQFGTNFVGYLDSTGGGTPQGLGYEYKVITPNAPLSVGESFEKDYDSDEFKELTVAGIGAGTGSIGVIKHTGIPGSNQFSTLWWDSSGIFAAPNMGIDTGYIDDKFSVLYPTLDYKDSIDVLYLLSFTRNSIYNFYKSSFQHIDSAAFLNGKFIDIENDNKINILSPTFFGSYGNFSTQLRDFEQAGTINIQLLGNQFPKDFLLYQNYPNPFNPMTIINYELRIKCNVNLSIYDILGNRIETLINKKMNSGYYKVIFYGSRLSSGVYFYSLFIDEQWDDSKKMLLIK